MISKEYATNLESLTNDFGTAWYQLMSRDIGPRTRCLGEELPIEIQPWEKHMAFGPLSTPKPDYIPIRIAIQNSIDETPSNIASFATLAIQCASTFRSSDYQGGCNGAAIRFPPSIDWDTNNGAHASLVLLEPIKNGFPNVSWSDLIILAGQTAMEAAGGNPLPFCGGRVDVENGDKSVGLEPKIYNNNTYDSVMYDISNKGLSLAEGIALFATPNLPLANIITIDGVITTDNSISLSKRASVANENNSYQISNALFVELNDTDPNSVLLMGDLGNIVNQFANDNEYFLEQYAKAYNYLMTADLFAGPTKNACQGVSDPTIKGQTGLRGR